MNAAKAVSGRVKTRTTDSRPTQSKNYTADKTPLSACKRVQRQRRGQHNRPSCLSDPEPGPGRADLPQTSILVSSTQPPSLRIQWLAVPASRVNEPLQMWEKHFRTSPLTFHQCSHPFGCLGNDPSHPFQFCFLLPFRGCLDFMFPAQRFSGRGKLA